MSGIHSLHSWIKSQTMIKPSKIKERSFDVVDDEEEPEVVIRLTALNPQTSRHIVRYKVGDKLSYLNLAKTLHCRFNAITGKYHNVKVGLRAAGMIDHLDIRSTIVHIDSKEVSVHKSSCSRSIESRNTQK
mgnify:CR=1 FL=1